MATFNVSNRIRCVALQIHDDVSSLDKDGNDDGHCSLKGLVGEVFNIVGSKMFTKGFGCSMFGVESIGKIDPSTNQYDGALGHVQRGEADFVWMPSYYPLDDPNGDFTFTSILYADTMTMFTAYFVNTSVHHGNMFSMFASVPSGLWIGYLMSFLSFVLISAIGSKILNENYGSLWTTISAFLDQGSFPTAKVSKFISVMSFIVMTGMFLMTTFITCSLSTDLVTIEEPRAVTTYDQILDMNMTTAFTKVLPEWEKFSSSPKGSKEWKLFERKQIVKLDPMIGSQMADKFLHQKYAFISRPFIARACPLVLMALPGLWPPEARAYVAPDPQAKEYSNGFVVSSRIKGTPIYNYICSVVTRMGEHGFAAYVQERIGTPAVDKLVGGSALPSHEQLVTSKIEKQSPDVMDIGFSHIRRVIITVFLASLAGVLTLIMEQIKFYHVRKEKKCRQQIMIEQRWKNRCRREELLKVQIERLGTIVEERRLARGVIKRTRHRRLTR